MKPFKLLFCALGAIISVIVVSVSAQMLGADINAAAEAWSSDNGSTWVGSQALVSAITTFQEATDIIHEMANRDHELLKDMLRHAAEDRAVVQDITKGLNDQAQACRDLSSLIKAHKSPANRTDIPLNPDGDHKVSNMTAGVLDYLRDLNSTATEVKDIIAWNVLFGIVMQALGLFAQITMAIATTHWHFDEKKLCPKHKDERCSCPPEVR